MSNRNFKANLEYFCDYSSSKVKCDGYVMENVMDPGYVKMNDVFKHGTCSIPLLEKVFEDLDAAWLVLMYYYKHLTL